MALGIHAFRHATNLNTAAEQTLQEELPNGLRHSKTGLATLSKTTQECLEEHNKKPGAAFKFLILNICQMRRNRPDPWRLHPATRRTQRNCCQLHSGRHHRTPKKCYVYVSRCPGRLSGTRRSWTPKWTGSIDVADQWSSAARLNQGNAVKLFTLQAKMTSDRLRCCVVTGLHV